MITRMDRDVGRILDLLEELDINENTIVLFTSDNGNYRLAAPGEPDFLDANGPLRGGKQNFYEGGIRVPMIVRWPGKVAAEATDDINRHSIDVDKLTNPVFDPNSSAGNVTGAGRRLP